MISNNSLKLIWQMLDNIEDVCADTNYWGDDMWTREEVYKLVDVLQDSVDTILDTLNGGD